MSKSNIKKKQNNHPPDLQPVPSQNPLPTIFLGSVDIFSTIYKWMIGITIVMGFISQFMEVITIVHPDPLMLNTP